MFKTDYKKLCEDLKLQLKHQCSLMEEMSTHSDKLHIVKFVVDNSDQFSLDGEFAIDESLTVYRGQPVSVSEAIMFKAGKEAANRDFDVIAANQDKRIYELEQEIDKLKRDLQLEKTYSQHLHNSMKQSLEDNSQYNEQVAANHDNVVSAINHDLFQVKSELRVAQENLSAANTELEKWRRGEFIEMPLPIYTDFGVIGGEL